MKQILKYSFLVAALIMSTICSFAQSFNGNTLTDITGDFSAYTAGSDLYVATNATITNLGADTLKIKIPNDATTVTFWNKITKLTGNTDSTLVQVLASADEGTGTDFVQLYAGYAANVSGVQLFKYNQTGNPYTNYWIIATGHHTTTTSTLSSKVLVRGRKK